MLYVQDGSATLLATVQELDQVYVDVVQTSGEFLKLKRDIPSGQLESDADGKLHVKLILEDGTQYPQDGILQLFDVTLSTTGISRRCTSPEAMASTRLRAASLQRLNPCQCRISAPNLLIPPNF